MRNRPLQMNHMGNCKHEMVFDACGVDGMLDAMEAGFPKLVDYTTTIDATPTGPPFTAHHKMNLKTMYIECDMALPVPDGAAVAEFDARRLGGGRYFKVTLAGKYDYLELAWHSVMSHLRMRKIKQDSSRPSLEVYENGLRATVDSNDIRTTLLVPVR